MDFEFFMDSFFDMADDWMEIEAILSVFCFRVWNVLNHFIQFFLKQTSNAILEITFLGPTISRRRFYAKHLMR